MHKQLCARLFNSPWSQKQFGGSHSISYLFPRSACVRTNSTLSLL